jgi:hypothetical protein
MNEIVEFQPEHLASINDIEVRPNPKTIHEGEVHKKAGPTATIIVDGKVAACGGVHQFWPGTGEGWVSIDKNCANPSLLKTIRECFDIWMQKFDRIQAMTITGWTEGERMMQFLGFEFEAVLRKMGPNGVDKSLYGRVK